jgi:hypothetical protein
MNRERERCLRFRTFHMHNGLVCTKAFQEEREFAYLKARPCVFVAVRTKLCLVRSACSQLAHLAAVVPKTSWGWCFCLGGGPVGRAPSLLSVCMCVCVCVLCVCMCSLYVWCTVLWRTVLDLDQRKFQVFIQCCCPNIQLSHRPVKVQ